ncbi:MAG: D-glycero-alpha-D-manno-heptose-1,7-bisphosphate 7-phosphatase [Acidobacteriaceae bacterium]
MSDSTQHSPPDLPRRIQFVFLDRDGVINRKAPEGKYVSRWSEFQLLPGAEAAIAHLHHSGRRVILVSNQRGVALGLYTTKDVEILHKQLQRRLAHHGARIDAFYFCPHDKNQCECRKPKPGLFLQAFKDFPEASPQNSIVIGDSLSDIQAAYNLGMRSIFIQGDPEFQKPGAAEAAALADAASSSLTEAVFRYLP